MRLDPKTLQAVATLSGSNEFMLFMKQLENELKKADVSLRGANHDTFQVTQGRATLLAELIQLVSSAQDDVFALKNK